MANWTDDETLLLIELWSEDGVQAQLEGCRKNQHVYEKIVDQLKDAGYERTVEQCRYKMKKLKQDYRKIVDSTNKTGQERKT